MNEKLLITEMLKGFSRSNRQRNRPFECDAEIVDMHGVLYGFSMDDFSFEEDGFTNGNLESLGKNLAVATISDLLAAGCSPEFYMHAIAAPDDAFAVSISKGIKEVLEKCSCFLIGGDLGMSPKWRYTGVAFGAFGESRPLTRIIPEGRQNIWITGRIGDANLSFLTGTETPEFEPRLEEAKNIRKRATAAIDTSGGFMESLWDLHLLNPGREFQVGTDLIPYDPAVISFCRKNVFPPAAFLYGGAGEYEILFTARENETFSHAIKIGTVTDSDIHDNSGAVYLGGVKIENPPPGPREFNNKADYIGKILEVVNGCF